MPSSHALPPSSPFAPRETDAVHASPFTPRDVDAVVDLAFAEPLDAAFRSRYSPPEGLLAGDIVRGRRRGCGTHEALNATVARSALRPRLLAVPPPIVAPGALRSPSWTCRLRIRSTPPVPGALRSPPPASALLWPPSAPSPRNSSPFAPHETRDRRRNRDGAVVPAPFYPLAAGPRARPPPSWTWRTLSRPTIDAHLLTGTGSTARGPAVLHIALWSRARTLSTAVRVRGDPYSGALGSRCSTACVRNAGRVMKPVDPPQARAAARTGGPARAAVDAGARKRHGVKTPAGAAPLCAAARAAAAARAGLRGGGCGGLGSVDIALAEPLEGARIDAGEDAPQLAPLSEVALDGLFETVLAACRSGIYWRVNSQGGAGM
ncbi:hypothetical protein DFH09DRAFT_1384174 [Mycena vulgaris]|nr:hypothetical protein DFH09DRAFT_1384174 [Mycena vulgaris]